MNRRRWIAAAALMAALVAMACIAGVALFSASEAVGQAIDVGPVHVDTGNDLLDLVFAVVIVVVAIAVAAWAKKRWGK